MGKTAYEKDVVAWATEQAALLRAGNFSDLDVEHIAEEIEDVGKSEQRKLASRMAVLLAHFLKWAYQPDRRGARWQRLAANLVFARSCRCAHITAHPASRAGTPPPR